MKECNHPYFEPGKVIHSDGTYIKETYDDIIYCTICKIVWRNESFCIDYDPFAGSTFEIRPVKWARCGSRALLNRIRLGEENPKIWHKIKQPEDEK